MNWSWQQKSTLEAAEGDKQLILTPQQKKDKISTLLEENLQLLSRFDTTNCC